MTERGQISFMLIKITSLGQFKKKSPHNHNQQRSEEKLVTFFSIVSF